MQARNSPPEMRKPMTLVERAERLREKMIASALLQLEDWSPVRAPIPTPAPAEAKDGDDVVRRHAACR